MSSDEIQVDDIFQRLDEKQARKKKINSKAKGDRGELKACKILTDFFGIKFNKVPRSGGFGTTHQLEQNALDVLIGDIITPQGFLFTLENKSGYDIDLINFFCSKYTSKKKSSDKTLIHTFLDQSVRDAVRASKIPAVIYTKDRRPSLLIIPSNNFSGENYLKEKLSEFELYLTFKYVSKYSQDWTDWVLVSLEESLYILPNDFFFINV